MNAAIPVGWIPFNNTQVSNHNALSAGQDSQGNEIYIGRGMNINILTPGRISFEAFGNKQTGLYIESNKTERLITINVEYYANNRSCDYKWVPSSGGKVVVNAVGVFGVKKYYIGRVVARGSLQLGKVALGSKLFYAPDGVASSYEVLVCNGNKKLIRINKFNFFLSCLL